MAVEIVHHVRKPAQGGQFEAGVSDARGASALVNAARSVRVLNAMTEAEAQQLRVGDRRGYFRATDGKANYGQLGGHTWYHLVPIDLPNGDSVASVEASKMPSVFEDVTTANMMAVRVRAGAANTGAMRSPPTGSARPSPKNSTSISSRTRTNQDDRQDMDQQRRVEGRAPEGCPAQGAILCGSRRHDRLSCSTLVSKVGDKGGARRTCLLHCSTCSTPLGVEQVERGIARPAPPATATHFQGGACRYE